MIRRAFFPGSFDPFTNGHLDILQQAFGIADEVVIGIGVHASKPGLFSFQERKELIEESVSPPLKKRLEIKTFDNLTVDAARQSGASMIMRGLRSGTDLDYEMQLAGMNGTMAQDIQTVFLPASPETRPITATLVRQVAQMGGDVRPFVPEVVARALEMKLSETVKPK